MSFITNIVGSGAGVIAIVVGFLIMQHMQHAPSFTHNTLKRFIIVVMYAGGAALAVTVIGHFVDDVIVTAAGWFGGLDFGLVRVILVVAILVLLAGVVTGLIWSPDPGTAMVAAFLPVLLALPLGGLIHGAYTAFDGPALALANALNHLVGG